MRWFYTLSQYWQGFFWGVLSTLYLVITLVHIQQKLISKPEWKDLDPFEKLTLIFLLTILWPIGRVVQFSFFLIERISRPSFWWKEIGAFLKHVGTYRRPGTS